MTLKWKSRRAGVVKNMRRNFVAGIVVSTPIVATIFVMRWLFGILDGILGPIVELTFGRPIPGIGFVVLLILIYLSGLLAANVFGKRVIRHGESLMEKVPMVREVYNTFRQVVDSLMLAQRGAFKEVVLVEFPRTGMTTVAFVTNRVTDSSGQELLNVFIPTAPNPTSGFFQIIPPDGVIRTTISVQEAMKMVVSAGMVSPATIDFGLGEEGAI